MSKRGRLFINTRLDELAEEIRELRDRADDLRAALRPLGMNDPRNDELIPELERVKERIGELMVEYTERVPIDFTPVSEPVEEDAGVLAFFYDLILRAYQEVGRELTRDDLTPYMYSMLRRRHESLQMVFNMLGGRSTRNAIDETEGSISSYVLYAEYDDGSIDFAEADDKDEADRIEDTWIADGAVVTRYRALREVGRMQYIASPILPLDNQQKAMPTGSYVRLCRIKKNDKFNLPPELYDLVVSDHWGDREVKP